MQQYVLYFNLYLLKVLLLLRDTYDCFRHYSIARLLQYIRQCELHVCGNDGCSSLRLWAKGLQGKINETEGQGQT
jgi:hypothetical protein